MKPARAFPSLIEVAARCARIACLAGVWVAGAAATQAADEPAPAQDEPPIAVQVPRIARPPHIDGRLDDDTWQSIAPLTAFVQLKPKAGAPATQRTELRLAHDGRMLYGAVRAHGLDVTARTLRRDAEGIEGDDHFTLVLDPRGSGRNGFYFRINALGAQRDGLVFDGGTPRAEWDAVWDAAALIDPEGWSAEFAIPLSALAAPVSKPGEDAPVWRVNAQRYTAATGERASLYGAEADRDVESLSDAGRLTGIAPETEGWGLRLQPGLRAAWQQQRDGHERSVFQPTLDAFWSFMPGATATLTVNTDFSDAELDDRVVSLSRFELFRPEKRAFFTQDAGRFAFGGLDTDDEPDLLPFFSRRVALGSTLDVGLKLSGSAGPVEFGALATQVDRDDGPLGALPRAPRIGVVRLATGIGDAHRVGMIATQGHPQGVSGSSLAGFDYQLRRDVFDDKLLEAYVWALQSRNAGLGTGDAEGASIAYRNYGPWFAASVRRVDERFEPALGFLQEAGVNNADIELGWQQKLEGSDTVLPRLFAGQRKRHDGSERSDYIGPNVEYTTPQGDLLGAELFAEQETVAAAFEILPGVTVPAGHEHWRYAAVYGEASASREWSGSFELRSGGLYGGRLHEGAIELAWRPSAHWGYTVSTRRLDVDFGAARSIARVHGLRLDHAGDTRSNQSLVVQYDNISRQTAVGLRARWILAPGREVLLSCDSLRPGRDDVLQPLTQVSAKLVWNWER